MSDLLQSGLDQLSLEASEQQHAQLNHYLDLLSKWNKVYNLTAIRDRQQMVIHHLLDSLAVLPYLKSSDQVIIDLGTGAGIPGIPLALFCPDKTFVLVDSNGKKTRFVTQACIELKLSNCQIRHIRAEQCFLDVSAQVVISRAFTSLQNFADRGAHLLAKNGRLLAMKGKYPQDEVEELNEKFKIVAVSALSVPHLDEERHLIEMQQVE